MTNISQEHTGSVFETMLRARYMGLTVAKAPDPSIDGFLKFLKDFMEQKDPLQNTPIGKIFADINLPTIRQIIFDQLRIPLTRFSLHVPHHCYPLRFLPDIEPEKVPVDDLEWDLGVPALRVGDPYNVTETEYSNLETGATAITLTEVERWRTASPGCPVHVSAYSCEQLLFIPSIGVGGLYIEASIIPMDQQGGGDSAYSPNTIKLSKVRLLDFPAHFGEQCAEKVHDLVGSVATKIKGDAGEKMTRAISQKASADAWQQLWGHAGALTKKSQ